MVRQLIWSSCQQGTAVAAGHHGGHHRRLVAALLLQELQVQLGGHRHLVARLLGGLPVLVQRVRQGRLGAGSTGCELEVGQLTMLGGATAVHGSVTADVNGRVGE